MIYLVFTEDILSFAMELGNDVRFARLREKATWRKEKKMRENGWHLKSSDRFARLNKSNGAHLRVESQREEKEIYEERSKKDGRRTTGRSGRKEGQCRSSHWPWHSESWLLLWYVPFSRRHRPRRERIRIYRDLPRKSLVNLYFFLSV